MKSRLYQGSCEQETKEMFHQQTQYRIQCKQIPLLTRAKTNIENLPNLKNCFVNISPLCEEYVCI